MDDRRILFVDDDPNVLAAFQRTLRHHYKMDTAQGGIDALALLRECGPYAVIVADMQMPGMNGLELLKQAQQVAPETVRIMLTGNADQQTAVDAVNQGAVFKFLGKPCPPELLRSTLDGSLQYYHSATLERELLESTLAGSVKILSDVLSMVEPSSFGRGQKLRDSIRVFGRYLQLPSTWELEVSAMLSQLGFVSIPQTILRKLEANAALSMREQGILEKAPQIGHDLIANIPRMQGVAQTILYQQKRFDGLGFPKDDVSGDKIPFGARVLKILLDRAVLEEDGVAKNRAFEIMQARAGLYDPALLKKCFDCFQAFLENAISAERTVKSCSVGELRAGDVLVSDARTLTGLLLMSAGGRLTEAIINRLRNYAELDGIKEPIFTQ